MKIDVLMRTKNSAENSRVFKQCLAAIKREIPINRFIVVDDSDVTSKTQEFLQQMPELELYRVKGNRAKATQVGIEQVETDWFFIVDDDVILCPDWWYFAQRVMELSSSCGLVWGWTKIINPQSRSRQKIMAIIRGVDDYLLCLRNFDHRGGLHDTLIRKEAVEGIQIPPDLHVYEDWYIKNFVEQQGFATEAPLWLWCYHYLNPQYSVEQCYELGRLNKKYGLYSTKYTVFRLAMGLPKALAILLTTWDLKAARDQIKYYTYEALGFLRTRKEKLDGVKT